MERLNPSNNKDFLILMGENYLKTLFDKFKEIKERFKKLKNKIKMSIEIMNKCRTCNKRIWLSKNWCMKCLEIIVNNLTKNKEK